MGSWREWMFSYFCFFFFVFYPAIFSFSIHMEVGNSVLGVQERRTRVERMKSSGTRGWCLLSGLTKSKVAMTSSPRREPPYPCSLFPISRFVRDRFSWTTRFSLPGLASQFEKKMQLNCSPVFSCEEPFPDIVCSCDQDWGGLFFFFA